MMNKDEIQLMDALEPRLKGCGLVMNKDEIQQVEVYQSSS